MNRILFGLAATALSFCGALAQLGDDGLHKEPWFEVTFKDVGEDIATASERGLRHAIIFEQRGCIYCRMLHEEVFSDPEVRDYIVENYMFVQYNLWGDETVIDLDGTEMSEKEMAQRWGVLYTPTILFMPDTLADQATTGEAAVSVMPGAFPKGTVIDMLTWVVEKGYELDEHFQAFHARRIREREAGQDAQ